MSTQTNKKGYGKIIALVVALVLITACVLLIVFLPRKQTAYAVMECSVNPQVQFVLDTDNKVMYINYLNEDAQILLSNENLEGKDADEAVQIFVKLCLESGFMDVNTTGDRVDVVIYCDNTEAVQKLSEDIVKSINDYFDENGIIAGAVADIKQNFSEALEKINSNIQDVANLTQQEILNLISETSEDIKDISYTLRSSLFEYIEELRNSEMFQNIPSIEQLIEDLQAQLEQSQISDKLKDQLNSQIEEARKNLNELLDELNKYIDEKIDELRRLSQEIFDQAKLLLNEKIEQTRSLIDAHKQYFEQNKDAVLAAIEEYRQTLA